VTKSELIELIASKQTHLSSKDVELAVKSVLDVMSNALAEGQRIEIRGFGSFSLQHYAARQGRNPKTGKSVVVRARHAPRFKPGLELRERVNDRIGIPTTG